MPTTTIAGRTIEVNEEGFLAHPDLPDLVERVDIYKWGHAMVRPTPGFIWGEERTRAQVGPARVHFAHSDLSATSASARGRKSTGASQRDQPNACWKPLADRQNPWRADEAARLR